MVSIPSSISGVSVVTDVEAVQGLAVGVKGLVVELNELLYSRRKALRSSIVIVGLAGRYFHVLATSSKSVYTRAVSS